MMQFRQWVARLGVALVVAGGLAGCAVGPVFAPEPAPVPGPAPASPAPSRPVLEQPRSHWVPARWDDLPGFADDSLYEAWNAWIKSCERPAPVFAALCQDIRRLSIATPEEQRAWMRERLVPYRVESAQPGAGEGLLTGYYEPLFEATRQPHAGFDAPLYRPPVGLTARRPWYTRQEIDTLPEAQAALRGREIAYLNDPVDALLLQIQGSGRLRVSEADGTQRLVRVAFAGSNEQPYRSVGRWLLDQGALRDASWPSIRAWVRDNPQRAQDLLWSNPRVVFFREEPLSEFDASFGPRGAQGVALTPGRSIAVDPQSIPYGTPVWLASLGPQAALQRLVLAQDTGSAIQGALRADYFTGWGADAGELAGRLRQPLQLWVLWPK